MKKFRNATAIRDSKSPVAVGIPKDEAKLQRSLLAALARDPLRNGSRRVICSELDVWHGIADVVVATANGHIGDADWLTPKHLKLFNLTTTKLLAQLRYGA